MGTLSGNRIRIVPDDDGATDSQKFWSVGNQDSEVLVVVKADTWGGATVALEVSPNNQDFGPILDHEGNPVVISSSWTGLIAGYGFIRGVVTGFAGSSGLVIAAGE